MFCFPCRFFGIGTDQSLTVTGFHDWKHARGKSGTLTSHDRSCSKHHHAVLSWKEYNLTVANNSSVALQIQKGRQTTVEENRLYVKNILSAILFCCQQGIALRGHREVMDVDDPSTNVGNFRSLMLLLSRSMCPSKRKPTLQVKSYYWDN